MAKTDSTGHSRIPGGQVPQDFQNMSPELSPSGQLYIREVAKLITEIAPRPGCLVYAHAQKLEICVNGLEAVVFSAFDVTTHLQVAQVHLALTTAAAITFVDFVLQSFPFGIAQIRTTDEAPFHHAAGDQSHRDFSATMRERDIVHSIIAKRSTDALFHIAARFVFGAVSHGSLSLESGKELQSELSQFLFFHNNHRSIPWLDGNTPLQRLKKFDGFAAIHSFSPSEGFQSGPDTLGTTDAGKRM